jgi:hypothetical protein
VIAGGGQHSGCVIGGCGGQHSDGLGGDDGRGAEVSGVANVGGGGSRLYGGRRQTVRHMCVGRGGCDGHYFVGSDGGSETVSVGHVVDTSGSAIGILDGIGADFVAMSVTLLFPSVLGAILVIRTNGFGIRFCFFI